jgi:hypothetical protein
VKRLRDGQNVTLLHGTSRLQCKVVAVSRDEAALHPMRMLGRPLNPQDDAGEATLAFDYMGTLVAIGGWVRLGREDDDDIRFTARGVHMPQPRKAARLRIALTTHVTWANGVKTEARTADISTTGIAIKPAGPAREGDVIDVELVIPDQLPPLETKLVVIRAGRERVAAEFQDLPPEQRRRLSRFILAVQRMIATGEVAAS